MSSNQFRTPYTQRPRHIPSFCVACRASLAGRRSRQGVRGRTYCNSCGKTAQEFARTRLVRVLPRLAVLYAERPALRWLTRFLRNDLLARLDRYPNAEAHWVFQDVMPYYSTDPKRVPPKTKDVPKTDNCSIEGCRRPVGANQLRWQNRRFCVACFHRIKRAHCRAAVRFNVLYKLVDEECPWVFGLLSPTLRKRLFEHRKTRRLQALSIHREPDWI